MELALPIIGCGDQTRPSKRHYGPKRCICTLKHHSIKTMATQVKIQPFSSYGVECVISDFNSELI